MYDFPANIGTSRHENDIIAILARLQRIGLPDNPIAFYGSSSFRIWSSVTEDLGSLDIVNLGFGGGTYLSASHYLHQLLVPLKPGRVVLYFRRKRYCQRRPQGWDGASSPAGFARQHFACPRAGGRVCSGNQAQSGALDLPP